MEQRGTNNLMSEIASELSTAIFDAEIQNRRTVCISRWPVELSGLIEEKYYTPQMVSLGPFHQGKPALLPMERHKMRALDKIIQSGTSLGELIGALQSVEENLKRCYDRWWMPANQWAPGDFSFLKMMLLDGCFLLVLLLNLYEHEEGAQLDPIFGRHGKIFLFQILKQDMLLLENQIPLLVLHELIQKLPPALIPEDRRQWPDVENLVADFFFGNGQYPLNQLDGSRDHLTHALDVYRRCLIHTTHPQRLDQGAEGNVDEHVYVRSATRLYRAGISFEASRVNKNSLMGIRFHRPRAVLTLPKIKIDDSTKSTFLNLVAFERSNVGAGDQVTSFVAFMYDLIDTAEDVDLLCSKGVIDNRLGSNKDAADLFNSLADGVISTETYGYTADVRRSLSSYTATAFILMSWWAHLYRITFDKPTSVLTFICGPLLVLLTTVLAVFAILDYKENARF